ncbi:MAG: hypothetical protein HN413_08155 [Chloroflexi bacterium]|nr:hypothetical protein [Chloroflexota bacterium]
MNRLYEFMAKMVLRRFGRFASEITLAWLAQYDYLMVTEADLKWMTAGAGDAA